MIFHRALPHASEAGTFIERLVAGAEPRQTDRFSKGLCRGDAPVSRCHRGIAGRRRHLAVVSVSAASFCPSHRCYERNLAIDRVRYRHFVFMALVASAFCWGCKKQRKPDRPTTYAVSGRVFVAGQPAAGAEVQLWAVDGDLKRAGYCPHAAVKEDGSFQLTTYATGDGAPAGEYAITLRWPLPPPPGREQGPDRFQGRYADPAKPLQTVSIIAAENNLEAIRLD